MFLVPTNVLVSGNTTAVEGTTVLLQCLYTESYPAVNNVTFFENGQAYVSVMVWYTVDNFFLIHILKTMLWVFMYVLIINGI